jgi:hypothetical protein
LRKFLVLTNDVSSEETFLRVFRVLDPKQFESAFRRWVGSMVGALSGNIAVDGKMVRTGRAVVARPLSTVSAFATDLPGKGIVHPADWPECKTKASLRLKRKAAAWDDDLRMKMLRLSKR